MKDKMKLWWDSHLLAKLGSLLLAGLTLLMMHRELPMQIDWAQDKALISAGAIIWPLVMLPWLYGLPLKRQLLGFLLGATAGYLLMGRPAIVVVHGTPFPNIDIMPYIAAALAVGLALFAATGFFTHRKWITRFLSVAPVLGMVLLLVTVSPTNAALKVQPGQVGPGKLSFEVAETYELGAELLAVYTHEDLVVAIGHKEMLWRRSSGEFHLKPGDYDPWWVKAHCDGQRLYIVETAQGFVECYSIPQGELLWTRTDLGAIADIAWTEDYLWVLNSPDVDSYLPWPEDPEVVLHQIEVNTGQGVEILVSPPDDRFWNKSRPLAYLETNGEQAWVVGSSSIEKKEYGANNNFIALETDEPFIFIPAQGSHTEVLRSLPGGLMAHPVIMDLLGYYLSDNVIVDITPINNYTDYAVRARSLLTGTDLWQRQLLWNLNARGYMARPFPAQGKVLVDHTNGILCLSEDTGEELWSFTHSTHLRWVQLVENDVILGMADGTIVRMGPEGNVVWQYQARGLSNFDSIDTALGTITILDSGHKNEHMWFTIGGNYVTLSLSDGEVVPADRILLEGGNFATTVDYVWHTSRFTYNPGPYNGDEAIYRLAGRRVIVRDLNIGREELVVRPDYLLVAEQFGNKARVRILRVKE